MEMEYRNILVTGALGFIGSNYVNHIIGTYDLVKIVILDIKDYCASEKNVTENPRVKIMIGDVANIDFVSHILKDNNIDCIVHFAAQTHVDNSFLNSVSFTEHNVLGAHRFIETVKKYHDETKALKKFLHISTDEVYGDVTDGNARTEKCILDPTNPYAASKAAAEFIMKSYYYSYGLPIVISRCNNVYGINQYPEKLIPKCICQLLNGEKMVAQGSGLALRNYIHVDDVSRALHTILTQGVVGEIYNIRSDHEYTVLEVMKMLAQIHNQNIDPDSFITYGPDRCFNDTRYHISGDKLNALGWEQEIHDFENQLKMLYIWYHKNKSRYGF